MQKLFIFILVFFLLNCSTEIGLNSIRKDFNNISISEGLNNIENDIETIFKIDLESFVILEIMEFPFFIDYIQPSESIFYILDINTNQSYEPERTQIKIYKYINNKLVLLKRHTFQNDFIIRMAYNEKYKSNTLFAGNDFMFNVWIKLNEIEYIKCHDCSGLADNNSELEYKYFSIINYLLTNLMISELANQLYE